MDLKTSTQTEHTEAAKKTLGKKLREQHQSPEWWPKELEDLAKNKKTAYQKWLESKDPDDRFIYARYSREVK